MEEQSTSSTPSELVETDLRGQGDPDLWDSIWTKADTLYTTDEPANLLEFWQRCYFEDLWSLVGNSPSTAQFLEQGAGRGTTSMYLLGKGCQVTMLDLAPHAFEIARGTCKHYGFEQPTYVVADARETNLPDNHYDCIYNIGLLEHFEDPGPVLEEAYRILKPGGLIFMVIVPAIPFRRMIPALLFLNPYRLLRYSIGLLRRKLMPGQRSQTSEMTRTDLPGSHYARIMEALGATDVACIPYNPYHVVYRKGLLERYVCLPIYKFHRALKQHAGQSPSLRTSPRVAVCDLLMARKPLETTS